MPIFPLDFAQQLLYDNITERTNDTPKGTTAMTYEIRETTATNDPADRGTLLAYAATFAEAQAKAAEYAAAGRNVSVCRAA
jgi:hypothetical protein